MMQFDIIKYDTPEYHEMVALRYRILREPLGLSFTEADLKKEADDIFCICKDNQYIIGCVILSKLDTETVKFRQMAIAEQYQGEGIGSQLIEFAEKAAKNHGFKRITLHARKVAKGFYEKNGYDTVGDEFTLVGIPHYEMVKLIDNK
ncbi:GNAT family N-acetyltransferase [Dysgonomonas sp. ZJ279]|uniref:GNAT family N-acetyltransferase n=1 Tax=Dysgonomonas sp. ZJ279 TaxID=2709796 RepID=UPI0013EDDE0A|nr:GNAT family N-acetyltransferase [Dysgonomonas sp. ZJ279]